MVAAMWRSEDRSFEPIANPTLFLRTGPLVDTVAKILGRARPDDIRQPFNERDRYRLERGLKNVKVITTHRGNSRRRWKIAKITTTPCSRTFFPMKEDSGGREESVSNYFRERYGTKLQFEHFPCVVVGDPAKHIYLPMEVCRVVPGQRILRKLNEKQTVSDRILDLEISCPVRKKGLLRPHRRNLPPSLAHRPT